MPERLNEVVISGISGRYPGARTTQELYDLLVKKTDLITFDETASAIGNVELPKYRGTVTDQDRFDNTLFGIHSRLAERMDINACVTLEEAFGAIIDAGMNPADLGGKEVPVVISSGVSKYDLIYACDKGNNGFSIVGGSQCMMANKMSHALNLKGPSFNLDGSWNGFFKGLRYAASLISSGMAEAAVVGCTSLGKLGDCSFHFARMGRLSDDGKTRSFSDDADGYGRSESCVIFFIQKKELARRIYGTIVDIELGESYDKDLPLADLDVKLPLKVLKKFYSKHPSLKKEISYVECSGESMKIWDTAELTSISEVLLDDRQKPLMIGCVKSNLGHTEDSSGGMALVKTMYSFDKGIIPPNLHYTSPNKEVPALVAGKMEVVTEPTEVASDYAAMNCFSVTGSMTHVLVKRNPKVKKTIPKVGVLPPDNLPRLFVASARNEEGIKYIMKSVEEMPIDEEFIAMGHKLYKNNIKQYCFRGYTILNDKSITVNETKESYLKKNPIWFVFSGMGSQWTGMGLHLMKIPIFAEAIHKCHNILKPYGLDLIDIITTDDKTVFDNILNCFVGIAAIQIGLVDILNSIGLVPDGIMGHSVGELGCAYADGCFTAEQMILAAYSRGKSSLDADLIPGMMAAVGLGYQAIKDQLPEGIDVACHNSAVSCTLSGPTKLMEEYVETLKAKNIFARLVSAGNIAYHSRYITPAAPGLLESLKKVIPEPKKRSSKWISSSVPAISWGTDAAIYCSAEYHTNNLLGSVLFEEASTHVPKDAIIVEIAPHGLLQAILKKAFTEAVHVPLTHRAQPDGVMYLLAAFGKLYLEGVPLDIENLYPPVEFPVSRETPSYEPFVFWNHDLVIFETNPETVSKVKNVDVSFNDDQYLYLKNIFINDEPFITPSVYLHILIDHFQRLNENSDPIIMDGFMMENNPIITDGNLAKLYLCFESGCGDWEICQEGVLVAKGKHVQTTKLNNRSEHYSVDGIVFYKDEIYNYLASNGIYFGQSLRLIQSLTFSDSEGSADIMWEGDWKCFFENVLLIPMLIDIKESSKLKLLKKIERLIIDVNYFKTLPPTVFKVSYDRKSCILWCDGLEILYPRLTDEKVPEKKLKKLGYQKLQFLPFSVQKTVGIEQLLDYSIEVIIQNLDVQVPRLNIIEVIEDCDMHQEILDSVQRKDGVKVDIMKVASIENVERLWIEEVYDSTVIVSRSKHIPIEFLKRIDLGYLVLINQTPPSSVLTTILEQKKESFSFALCKMKTDFVDVCDHILLSDPLWERNLEFKFASGVENPIYLIGSSTSLTYVQKIVQHCCRMFNSKNLKFAFFDKILDTFSASKYKNQLSKNLKINIYNNNNWGTYILKSITACEVEPTTDKDVFLLSDIRSQDIKLKSLGINLADVSAEYSKLGIIEYVGEKNGEEICGLATLPDDSLKLIPDDQLWWTKPKSWKNTDLASVLSNYSIAYFILKVDNNLKEGDGVFISQGIHPLSQALIRIALKNNLTVLTSYNKPENKEWILKTFPQIPECNLFDYNYKQIDTEIRLRTKSTLIMLAVNVLPESHLVEKTFHTLSKGGKFYQVSLSPMMTDATFGMFTFSFQVTFKGFPPSTLLFLSDETKKIIRQLVSSGLKSGEIEPLAATKLTSDKLNIDAVSHLMDKSCIDKKVVVDLGSKTLTKNLLQSYYFASFNKSYFIIGDSKNVWIKICHWLIRRGAQNIYVAIKKNTFASSANQLFDSLVHMNPSINLNLISYKRIEDKNAINKYLKDVDRLVPLAAVFVVGKENEESVKNLYESKTKFLLVSLCAGSETECADRIEAGLPSLAISTLDDSLKADLTLPSLDYLLTQKEPIVYISEVIGMEFEVQDLLSSENFQSLPSTPKEISQLVTNAKKVGWKEVRTSTLTHANSRELDPVFMLPTLKKSHMDFLIKSLMHPAFEAVIPAESDNITEVAKELAQEMLKFKQNEFTILCSDWAWSLGFEIARFLEELDKTVSILALDSFSKRVRKTVLQNYLIDLTVKLGDTDDVNIKKGLKVLENRLDCFHYSNKYDEEKYKGFLHIISPDSVEAYNTADLQENCERPIINHAIPSSNFNSLLNERKTKSIVNMLVLYEHKTPGKRVAKHYYEKCAIEHTWKMAKDLQRAE